MSKKPIHHIIDTLGSEEIASRFDVSSHMIRHARSSGVFPASWYADMKAWCEDVGIPCPMSLFNWKATANKTGNAATQIQGGAL